MHPTSLFLPSPSAFPDHLSTFSTVRHNIYDPAFLQKTRVLQFYQKGRTSKENTQVTFTERSFALCIFYQCLRKYQFSHSVVSDSLQLHGPHAARQASLFITNSQNLPQLMSIESVMPSNHLILCHPLLLPPLVFPASGSFQTS